MATGRSRFRAHSENHSSDLIRVHVRACESLLPHPLRASKKRPQDSQLAIVAHRNEGARGQRSRQLEHAAVTQPMQSTSNLTSPSTLRGKRGARARESPTEGGPSWILARDSRRYGHRGQLESKNARHLISRSLMQNNEKNKRSLKRNESRKDHGDKTYLYLPKGSAPIYYWLILCTVNKDNPF